MHAVAFLFALYASAASDKPVLDVAVKLHHSLQWTRIFHDHGEWYCVTEHNPRFPLAGPPKSPALVLDEREPKKACRETFTAVVTDDKGTRTWSACRKKAKAFLNELGKECGRF